LYLSYSNNLPVSCNRQAAGSNSCTFPTLTIYLLIVTDKLQGVILVHFLSNNLPVSCNRQAAGSNSCTFPTLTIYLLVVTDKLQGVILVHFLL